MPLRNFMAACRDRLARSRFFTLSLTFHLILIAFIGRQIITRIPPPEVVPTANMPQADAIRAPKKESPPVVVREPEKFNPTMDPTKAGTTESLLPTVPNLPPTPDIYVIKTEVGDQVIPIDTAKGGLPPIGPVTDVRGLTAGDKKAIDNFTQWRQPGGNDRFAFTAFIGKYQGGNWSSTVRMTNGEITAGSLPNLLYAMSKWSKDRVKTDERQVKAIALDSEELITARPPFIFLTGTKDFRLTDKEVENLRRYIRCGGAVWGDSSVPGQRSAFDLAFKREMEKVMGGNVAFERLPANHPVFADGYFSKVKQLPAGINQYQEPVEVLRWGGEIAIIHTTNDYGDMWQIGLDAKGQIDLSRNAGGEYVAMNSTLWDNRGTYVRNIDQPAVEEAYRFGINMVFHLLTRWESVTGGPATL